MRGAAVGLREVLREVVQVGDRGAAPAVDRLAGVADGGHRVPGAGAAAEQAGQHEALGDRGVLVLVEQHHPVLLAQQPADLGALLGEPGGGGDLVAEVEQAELLLAGPVVLDQVQQFLPAAGGLRDGPEVLVGELDAGQGVEQLLVVLPQLRGFDQVLGEFGVQRDQFGDQRGEGAGERRVGAAGLAQHPGGELEAGGVGEQPDVGLDAQPQAVLLQQGAGEGVVGGDLRVAERVVLADAGPQQRGADAFGEFAGGLVGEGQAEHLLGTDRAGADQPDHPGGHHGGLAGAGAGHDHAGRHGCADGRQLLVVEGDSEEIAELGRVPQLRLSRRHAGRPAARSSCCGTRSGRSARPRWG